MDPLDCLLMVVRRQVIHDDDVSLFEIRHPFVFDKGMECIVSRARIDSHEAAKTIEGYGAYPGDRSPFSANAFRVKLLPLASPPIAGWGAKSKPRSIHKHKASRL